MLPHDISRQQQAHELHLWGALEFVEDVDEDFAGLEGQRREYTVCLLSIMVCNYSPDLAMRTLLDRWFAPVQHTSAKKLIITLTNPLQ
jgi:hypothetical protein